MRTIRRGLSGIAMLAIALQTLGGAVSALVVCCATGHPHAASAAVFCPMHHVPDHDCPMKHAGHSGMGHAHAQAPSTGDTTLSCGCDTRPVGSLYSSMKGRVERTPAVIAGNVAPISIAALGPSIVDSWSPPPSPPPRS